MHVRRSSCLAVFSALVLTGCPSAIVGFHEITDYRAKYGAQTKGIKAQDIHGKEIMDGLRSPQERSKRTSSPKCSLALAISGGGSISAAFSYGVLREIADWDDVQVAGVPTSILSQVDYISTASGGGITGAILAGTFWEEELVEALEAEPFDPNRFNQGLRARFDSEDYKATFSERYMAIKDLLFSDGQDRLRRFRERLPIGVFGLKYRENNCEVAISFDDMFSRVPPESTDPKTQTYVRARSFAPVWIPNATSFADGTRVPLTSAVLKKLRVTGISHQEFLCRPKPTTFAEWPMSEALAASMSFPGIGPYRMESALGHLDLVDGGLADNLGVFTALDVVRADLEPGPQQAERGLVIVIDSSTDAESGLFAGETANVPQSEYLLEYGKTQLFAQYPASTEALDEAARRSGIPSVVIRARDFREDSSSMSLCSGLLPKSDKIPGAPGCPAHTTAEPTRVSQFVRDQRTSAAIHYAHADGLMQLGRMAASKVKGQIVSEFQRCLQGNQK